MSKGLIGLLAIAAVGGVAFAVSKAKAESNSDTPSSVVAVTGPSGTTYALRMLGEHSTGDGVVQEWEVSDASGVVLQYQQFRGDDTSRILVLTPDAPHKPGDLMWRNAVQDFSIFTSVAGLELQ